MTQIVSQQRQRLRELAEVYREGLKQPDPTTAIQELYHWYVVTDRLYTLEEFQQIEVLFTSHPDLVPGIKIPGITLSGNTSTQAATVIQPEVAESSATGIVLADPPGEIELQPKGDLATTTDVDAMGKQMTSVLSQLIGAEFEYQGCCEGDRIREFRVRQVIDRKDEKGNLPRIIPAQRLESAVSTLKVYASLPQGKSPVIRPQHGYIAIEVPRTDWKPVPIQTILPAKPKFLDGSTPLILPVGRNIRKEPAEINLSKRVSAHFSVVGSSGGGKNGVLDTIIYGSMNRYSPEHLQMLLFDPQRFNFQKYEGSPWLWGTNHILSSQSDVDDGLEAVLEEANRRASLFVEAGVEEIQEYNQGHSNHLFRLLMLFDELGSGRNNSSDPRWFDRTLGKIAREMGKLGIHLGVATQLNNADMIEGAFSPDLKANIGVKIAVRTTTAANSEKALGEGFDMARFLEGNGDAYILQPGMTEPERIQVYYSDREMIKKFMGSIPGTRFESYYNSRRPGRPSKGGDSPDFFNQFPDAGQDNEVQEAYEQCRPLLAIAKDPNDDPDWKEYQKVKEAIAAIKSRNEKVCETRVMQEVWGHRYDRPEYASKGANLPKNRDRLRRLLKKFEGHEDVRQVA
jgi:hypothetical protein